MGKVSKAFRGAFLSATLVIAIAACSSGGLPPNPAMSAGPGALQLEFERATPRDDRGLIPCPDPEEKSGVTEISLERTGCYGYCAMYTVTLRSDGSAAYQGRANVKHVGRFTGSLPVPVFELLAKAALELGVFDRLPSEITCPITDDSTTYLAFTREGQRRVISHYAPETTGPAALVLLEQSIDIVADQIDWKRESGPQRHSE